MPYGFNDDKSKYELNAADYIIEQGQSGDWFYRKWNSGIAECFGSFDFTDSFSKAGNGWYSSVHHHDFPSGLFNAIPIACSISGFGNYGFAIEYGGSSSATSTQSYYLMRAEGNTSTDINATIGVIAKGRWRN